MTTREQKAQQLQDANNRLLQASDVNTQNDCWEEIHKLELELWLGEDIE